MDHVVMSNQKLIKILEIIAEYFNFCLKKYTSEL